MSQSVNPNWGTVTVEDLGEEIANDRGESLRVHATRYCWTPDADLDLHPGFKLVLKCWDTDGKSRRFFPDESFEEFVQRASLAGTAILERLGRLNGHEKYSYHMSRLLFQRASGLQDRLMRKFVSARDLYVTAAARVAGEFDVLPASLGQDDQQEDKRWSVHELLARGRELAKERGHEAPNEEQCIRFGLLGAARLCPFDMTRVTKEQARGLVRMGLFGTGPSSEAVNELIKSQIEARLRAAIFNHLEDDQEKFDNWFLKNADNLIRQVAKQQHDGGPVSREIVRKVLLDLVFTSHGYIVQSIEVFLKVFARSPQVELTGDELEIFQSTYYCRDELGGLSLFVLKDRFPLIREVVLELWDSPQNVELFGVLLRLLQFYSEMVENRRAADRRYKSLSHHRNESGRTALTHGDSSDVPVGATDSRFEELAINALEARGIVCECDSSWGWVVRLADSVPGGDPLVELGCSNCGHLETAVITEDEIRAAEERGGGRR